MRAAGTSVYQASMGEEDDEIDRMSESELNGRHSNMVNAMLRFHAAYHILRQDVITLTKDTPLREKVKLANRRFMSLNMTHKMKSKAKDIRRKMELHSRCRAYVFRTMENPVRYFS